MVRWGIELWDKYEQVSESVKNGTDFLDRFGNFTRDRCKIEVEYAKQLRKLNQQYAPGKKDNKSDWEFTNTHAFLTMLNELNDLAGQHESLAENLNENVCSKVAAMVRELKDVRKRALAEGDRVQSFRNQHIHAMEKARKAYEKAYRDAEKAAEAFRRADADLNLSRVEVAKANKMKLEKEQECEEQKQHYAMCLKQANDEQAYFYREGMPKVFDQLQDAERLRITTLKQLFLDAANAEQSKQPIISRCLQGMIDAANKVDVEQDFGLLVELHKTGYTPPCDFPFLDMGSTLSGGSGINVNRSATLTGNSSMSSITTITSSHASNGGSLHHHAHGNNNNHNHSGGAADNTDSGSGSGLNQSDPPSRSPSFRSNHSAQGSLPLPLPPPPNLLASSTSVTTTTTIVGGNTDKTKREKKARKGLLGVFGGGGGSNANSSKDSDTYRDDFGDLPPNQRRKRLLQRLAELKISQQKETDARDGLLKMQAVYRDNPQLGDPNSINGQLEENAVKLERFHAERARLSAWLEDTERQLSGGATSHASSNSAAAPPPPATSFPPPPPALAVANGVTNHLHGIAPNVPPIAHQQQQQQMRQNSVMQQRNGGAENAALPAVPGGGGGGGGGGIGTTRQMYAPSHPSYRPQPQMSSSSAAGFSPSQQQFRSVAGLAGRNNNNSSNDVYEPSPGGEADGLPPGGDLPILGKALALYEFKAESEGTMSMSEHDEFYVIEEDQGDGWTRVKRTSESASNVEDGFVPTAYLEITLFKS